MAWKTCTGTIALLLALTACGGNGGDSAGKMPTVTLAIGSITALPTLPLQIAVNRNLFRKHGVNVKVQVTGSGSKAANALVAGQVDLTADFYEHVLSLAAAGKHLQSFVELTSMPGYAVVVTGKGAARIHGLADLAGKTVGVSAPGSATAFFVSYLLAKSGVSPNSAHFVGIGIGPSAVAAVEHDKVDAAVLYDPDLSQALAHAPSTRVLSDARAPGQAMPIFGATSYPSMTLFGTSAWIGRHPGEARSVASAIAEADRYLHQAGTAEIMSHLTSAAIGPDRAFYTSVLAKTIPYISPAGALDPSALQAVLKVQTISNPAVKSARIDLPSTFTTKFVSAS